MIRKLLSKGVEFRSCITCTKARGFSQDDFIEGVMVGKTIDLARWIKETDGAMVF
jgi:tRNA 2-thiouridine synthesizing protein D